MSEKYKYKQLEKTVDSYKYEVIAEYELFEKNRESTFKRLSADVKIAGFRPGQAPRKLIEQEIGSKVISEAINYLAQDIIFEIFEKENLNPVTSPVFNLEDLDEDKGVKFTFTFTNYPEIKLGDLKKIKVTKDESTVTDEEVLTVMKNIVRSSLPKERIKELTESDSSKSTKKTSKTKKSESSESKDEDFEINDKIVEELKYEKEKSVDEMKETVRAKLLEMKQQQSEDQYIEKLIEEAIKISEVEIPKIFIEREVHNMEHSFRDRLANLKLEIEEYLKTQGTSMEEKQIEWEETATKRIKSDLILITIATKHSIAPSDEDVTVEINRLEDPLARSQYETPTGRDYVKTILTRQRGINKLIELVENK